MSTKPFLGLMCILAAVACGGSATTDSTTGGNKGGGGGGGNTPVASKLAIQVMPAGTRTGTALTTQPVVVVQDGSGNLYTSGSYAVTASIASGGGSLSGSSSVATNNGVATFTDLTINGSSGPRSLTFSAPGLQSATSSSFTLTSQLLKSMAVLTTPSTTAQTMIALTQQPVFQLLDDANQPYITPTQVTASIALGNAIVASGGTVTSDANGKVTFSGLTLGALNGIAGPATLRFTAPGLGPGDFSIALSCVVFPLPFGTSLSGILANGDCTSGSGGNLAGRYIRSYSSTMPSVGGVMVTETSTAYHPAACIRTQTGTWGWCTGSTTSQANTKALINAGTFYARPSTDSVGQVGPFTVAVALSNSDITNCEYVYALFTATLSQNLTNTDCTFNNGVHFDDFVVPVAQGEGFIATFTAGFPLSVAVWLDTAYISSTSGYTAQVRYTNNTAGPKFPELVVSGLNGGQLGAYTFQHAMQYPAPDRVPTTLDPTFHSWSAPNPLVQNIAITPRRVLPTAPPPVR